MRAQVGIFVARFVRVCDVYVRDHPASSSPQIHTPTHTLTHTLRIYDWAIYLCLRMFVASFGRPPAQSEAWALDVREECGYAEKFGGASVGVQIRSDVRVKGTGNLKHWWCGAVAIVSTA